MVQTATRQLATTAHRQLSMTVAIVQEAERVLEPALTQDTLLSYLVTSLLESGATVELAMDVVGEALQLAGLTTGAGALLSSLTEAEYERATLARQLATRDQLSSSDRATAMSALEMLLVSPT